MVSTREVTEKDLYSWMCCWEEDNGESFVEYFIDNENGINMAKFVLWLYDNNHMNLGMLQSYIKKTFHNTFKFDEPTGMDLFFEDADYSLFGEEGQESELAKYKAYQLLASYIYTYKSGIKALYKFVFEGEILGINRTAEERADNAEYMSKIINNWTENEYNNFEYIKGLTVNDVRKMIAEAEEAE